jgi:hypothetical protein
MDGWKKHFGKAIGAGVFVVCVLIAPGLPGFLLGVGLALVWIVSEIVSDR